MPQRHYGRTRADLNGWDTPFAVFLIGARINTLWKVHQWWPAARAMPKILEELEAHPELGLLGYEAWSGRTSIMVQYWRSMDHLMNYARAKAQVHLPAWQAFNQQAHTDAIGIWHEAYVVRPGEFHTSYINMPEFGLRRAQNVSAAQTALPAPENARAMLAKKPADAGAWA